MVLKWLADRFKPADSNAVLLERAQALRMQDDFEAARQACAEVLREQPDHARAMALMAAIAADQRQVDAGLQWVSRALALEPACVPAHFARGRLLEAAERYPEAEASYRRVTELDPQHANAHTNLGCMVHIQGRLEEAAACYRQALALEPGKPEALRNYALVAGGTEQVREALQGFEAHATAYPGDAAAHHQIGHLYCQLGRNGEALAAYERALSLEPDRPEFRFARAQTLLLLGRYADGWREYEARWQMSLLNSAMLRFAQPRWDGSPLPEGTLLLHGESAFGDTIQLVRYAALAAQRCGRVVVECPPALQELVAKVEGIAQAVPEGDPLPPFDVQLPLIACPGLFQTTLETIPWRGPYFHAEPQRVQQWRALVAAAAPGTRKVGLVWTGNAGNLGNRRRSVTFEQLATLAQTGNASFFSLQKGAPPPSAQAIPPGMHFVDLTSRIGDFSDTAALLTQLDLLVAVDTGVAHLAGAMGVPTWLLLPFSADWRYHTGRDDNPWYPGIRLFRQHEEGDWSVALRQLAQAFTEWARG
jgi:Tfp pilus assembly protein PilF